MSPQFNSLAKQGLFTHKEKGLMPRVFKMMDETFMYIVARFVIANFDQKSLTALNNK
jgi:hypothetical protein